MRIISQEKRENKTVDNSKSHKKKVSKIKAPNLAIKNKKRTARTSLKAPSISNSIKNPTLPTVGFTEEGDDIGGISRPLDKGRNSLKKVRCDQFSCYINEDGTEAHIRHNKANPDNIIDDTSDTVDIAFNSNDWLLSQTTAVASVDIVNNFKISPSTAKFVNNNGNAFSDRILQKYYKTFIGAHNYKNHNQNPKESYGIILDAVLRAVPYQDTVVYYVDTLIATYRHKDKAWAKAIENGVVKFVSMGAESSSFRCSYCGNIPTSVDEFCDHFKYSRGKYFIDEKGRKLRIAHLVEDYKNKAGEGYVDFIELSYLDVNPAFSGASQAHIIQLPADTDFKLSIPKGYLSKSAFQTHKEHFKVL